MTSDRHELSGTSRVEGDEVIEVVRDTVQQLELLTGRLKSFLDNQEDPR